MIPEFETAVRNALPRAGFDVHGGNDCHVLLFDSATWTRHVDAASCWLDARELRRANRFHFEHDRHTYVLAHASWRIALGVFLDLKGRPAPLTIASSGQPTLPGTGASTSLSHSGSWVAMAMGKVSALGVDIERTPTRGALVPMAGEICTPGEISTFESLPEQDRETYLLALWTRKEALLKAFGIGLRAEPSSVPANTDETVLPPPFSINQTPCQVRNIRLPVDLVGALATPARPFCRWHLHQFSHTPAIDSEIS